eukprot:1162106-Pelagomonas_calceolata.AAC.3
MPSRAPFNQALACACSDSRPCFKPSRALFNQALACACSGFRVCMGRLQLPCSLGSCPRIKRAPSGLLACVPAEVRKVEA